MSDFPCASTIASRCNADGEFRFAARSWTGALTLRSPEHAVTVGFKEGVANNLTQTALGRTFTLAAPADIWNALFAAVPPRLANDIAVLIRSGLMELEADAIDFAQYYAAIMRVIELIRPRVTSRGPTEPVRSNGAFDAPVGRYVHLDIEGQDYRIYFEEAGQGIPLLLQHTAGCHGAQWRHILECKAITDHFRLIAYDLPFHGKSIPPVGPRWWEEEYRLTGDFIRSVPVLRDGRLCFGAISTTTTP